MLDDPVTFLLTTRAFYMCHPFAAMDPHELEGLVSEFKARALQVRVSFWL
jgi:hypothetical protein